MNRIMNRVKVATIKDRDKVIELVAKISIALEDESWEQSLAALTISIGDMARDIDVEDQADFVSYVAGVLSGMLQIQNTRWH
jgi:hypothetical protein